MTSISISEMELMKGWASRLKVRSLKLRVKTWECWLVFQDVPNVLVSNCGPRFFSVPLPGSILLILDFINAAGTIISAVDYKEVSVASFFSGELHWWVVLGFEGPVSHTVTCGWGSSVGYMCQEGWLVYICQSVMFLCWNLRSGFSCFLFCGVGGIKPKIYLKKKSHMIRDVHLTSGKV